MKALLTLSLMIGVSFAFADDKKDAKFEHEKMFGKYTLTEGKNKGKAINDDAKKGTYVIDKDKIHIQEDGKDVWVFEYKLNTKADPVEVDMTITVAKEEAAKGMKAPGIIKMDGDTVWLAYDPSGKERPKKFEGDSFHVYTLKKMKDEKKPGKTEKK